VTGRTLAQVAADEGAGVARAPSGVRSTRARR
jgi:hypothetical protein